MKENYMTVAGKAKRDYIHNRWCGIDPEEAIKPGYNWDQHSTLELLGCRPRTRWEDPEYPYPPGYVEKFYEVLNKREHIRTKAEAKADRLAKMHEKKHR